MAAISMAAVEARRGRARLRIRCRLSCIIEGMVVVMVEWQESGTRAKGAGRALQAGAAEGGAAVMSAGDAWTRPWHGQQEGRLASPVGVLVWGDWTKMMMRLRDT